MAAYTFAKLCIPQRSQARGIQYATATHCLHLACHQLGMLAPTALASLHVRACCSAQVDIMCLNLLSTLSPSILCLPPRRACRC
jgi:hypothetical protein